MAQNSLPESISIDNLVFAPKPQTSRFTDIEGTVYGHLTVLGFKGTKGNHRLWYCLCRCGKLHITSANNLRTKKTQSCGCLNHRIGDHTRTHGMSKSATYAVWSHMLSRCRNPKNNQFQNYAGRGIKVCERWLRFENFLADMGEKPDSNYSLDRIDNDGDYEPSNCRWATPLQQQNNTRQNRYITINGVRKTLAQWCRDRNLNYARVLARLHKCKWPVRKALEIDD